MSESIVIFVFRGADIIIKCNLFEKMKSVCQRFISKSKVDESILHFAYNGDFINPELNFIEQASEIDRKSGKMKILVIENENVKPIKNKIIESEEIICPICNESILIKINNYKIDMYKCKNNHRYDKLLFKEFINTQKIDISKIKCNLCNEKDKSNTYNNEMYICITCNKNICPLCRIGHDKSHEIINYEKKNIYCFKHNELFIKYCKDCNKNICMQCEKEHSKHIIIYYGDILPAQYNENEFIDYINKLKKEISEITIKLNKIIENIEYYKNQFEKIIKNKNRNYQILYSVNEFLHYNNQIISDIQEIINEENNNNKFNYLMNIYNKMNKSIDNSKIKNPEIFLFNPKKKGNNISIKKGRIINIYKKNENKNKLKQRKENRLDNNINYCSETTRKKQKKFNRFDELYQMGKEKQRLKRNRSKETIEIQEHNNEYTFHPNIYHLTEKIPETKFTNDIYNEKEYICLYERLKRGRLERKVRESNKERFELSNKLKQFIKDNKEFNFLQNDKYCDNNIPNNIIVEDNRSRSIEISSNFKKDNMSDSSPLGKKNVKDNNKNIY